jgi:hypothetical protein
MGAKGSNHTTSWTASMTMPRIRHEQAIPR